MGKTTFILYLLSLTLLHSCSNSELQNTSTDTTAWDQKVPYERDPKTPSQKQLIAISKVNYNSLKMKNKNFGLLNGKSFTGWTYQVFNDTNHKFRYVKFIAGNQVWQIGYYDNGTLDHDFHMFNGKNKGSQRMWRDDGTPYINNFFKEGGIKDGIQKRWYSDNRLAQEGLYENGVQVYEKHYDEIGNLVKRDE